MSSDGKRVLLVIGSRWRYKTSEFRGAATVTNLPDGHVAFEWDNGSVGGFRRDKFFEWFEPFGTQATTDETPDLFSDAWPRSY